MVLIVGYGTETSQKGVETDYWLVQNSWGPLWGDKGYFKILRGKNVCNISSDVWSPVVNEPLQRPLKVLRSPKFCDRSGDVLNLNGVEKLFCIKESVRKSKTFAVIMSTLLSSLEIHIHFVTFSKL